MPPDPRPPARESGVRPIDGNTCEVCLRITVEPIIHADTGDAFCGRCALELSSSEANMYRQALAKLVALKDGPRDASYERERPAAWQAARDALALRADES